MPDLNADVVRHLQDALETNLKAIESWKKQCFNMLQGIALLEESCRLIIEGIK